MADVSSTNILSCASYLHTLQSSFHQLVNLSNNRQLQCTVCRDFRGWQQMVRFTCLCVLCSTCLQRRFTRALKAEFMFPAKCCWNIIDITDVWRLLPPDIIRRYGAKKTEYETANRTYCANKLCSAFIVKECIKRRQAFCTNLPCNTITCTECKSKWHDGECPRDQDQELVLAEAEKRGWKRCARSVNAAIRSVFAAPRYGKLVAAKVQTLNEDAEL
ncbi:hypothetical protein EAE96_000728 [Botrytis aclada]|nr:hypothetical protein EAE96_000728 [Botrytis aclada]